MMYLYIFTFFCYPIIAGRLILGSGKCSSHDMRHPAGHWRIDTTRKLVMSSPLIEEGKALAAVKVKALHSVLNQSRGWTVTSGRCHWSAVNHSRQHAEQKYDDVWTIHTILSVLTSGVLSGPSLTSSCHMCFHSWPVMRGASWYPGHWSQAPEWVSWARPGSRLWQRKDSSEARAARAGRAARVTSQSWAWRHGGPGGASWTQILCQ